GQTATIAGARASSTVGGDAGPTSEHSAGAATRAVSRRLRWQRTGSPARRHPSFDRGWPDLRRGVRDLVPRHLARGRCRRGPAAPAGFICRLEREHGIGAVVACPDRGADGRIAAAAGPRRNCTVLDPAPGSL
ncbi:MAG: hypothetical protein AVDCRST_MAG70-2361, partial [uncultured Thermomicrobiales bacterium]